MKKGNENKVENLQSKENNSNKLDLKTILICEGVSLAITAGLWVATFALAPIIPVVPTVLIGFCAYMSIVWDVYFPTAIALQYYKEKKKNNEQKDLEKTEKGENLSDKVEQEANLTNLKEETKKENKTQKYKKLKKYFEEKNQKNAEKNNIEEDENQNVL